ncbi:hypothetical protein GJ744_006665 [Endocarpon pusillum]|uniref:Uncharacterized protein n=1 Tax=Endocarpon pusillum TaxID=364733 RepID=A0A8H7E838_9EURO|nr:hypothetical protein GJ744_006665 [Endocarpon pusillum]
MVPQYYPYRGKPKCPRLAYPAEVPVIKHVYGNLLTNWVYSATLQLTLNDLKPIWTTEGWSFIPVNLTEFSGVDDSTKSEGGISDQSPLSGPLHNITLDTPTLRARLQCSRYAEILNQSNWLIRHDLTNTSEWNPTDHPRGPKVGYELTDSNFGAGSTYLRLADDNYFATFYPRANQFTCCANQTCDGPGGAAVGYWSKLGTRFVSTLTSNISVMWLVGYRIEGLYQRTSKATGSTSSHWIWSEPPKLTGINCLPLMGSADAEVTIDPLTSIVRSHNITGKPRNFTAAWQDKYVTRKRSTGTDAGPPSESIDYIPRGNITASFGWIFLDALMGSATVSSNIPDGTFGFRGPEDLSARTFNFRMKRL